MTADQFEWSTERTRGDRELVDGVVVEGEMPNRRHQTVLAWLHALLDPWARHKGGGAWTNAEIRLGEHQVRQADLIAWWSGQDVPLDGMMRAVPDLVVEVISPQPRDVIRDREEKLVEYCAFGVPHYWIVEPLHQTVEIYLRQWKKTWALVPGWEYGRVILETRGVISPPAGPTFQLDALWAIVEG